jgi:filamentous hemagglutinin
MADQSAAAALNNTRPNLSWEQTVQKYSTPNQSESIWQRIIDASQRSNSEVNSSLGVFPDIKR